MKSKIIIKDLKDLEKIKITKENILHIVKEEVKKETDSKSKLSNGKN